MTIWAALLVSGVTAIWATLGVAMIYLISRAPHAHDAPRRVRVRER